MNDENRDLGLFGWLIEAMGWGWAPLAIIGLLALVLWRLSQIVHLLGAR